jgi:DNA-directed RNA polymerase specialized sigma24 family protein
MKPLNSTLSTTMDPLRQSGFADQQLERLLDAYHAAKRALEAASVQDRPAAEARLAAAEREALDWIYRYLHEHLKPQIRRSFPGSGAETLVRFTDMMNNLFVEVLERRPDSFWRAQSERALVGWVSLAITRDIRDCLKKRPVGFDGPEATDFDYVRPLAEARAQHFEEKHGLPLGPVLEEIARWENQPAPWPERAAVIRLRYIDGLSYAEIAAQLGLPKDRLYEVRDQALAALQDKFGH